MAKMLVVLWFEDQSFMCLFFSCRLLYGNHRRVSLAEQRVWVDSLFSAKKIIFKLARLGIKEGDLSKLWKKT